MQEDKTQNNQKVDSAKSSTGMVVTLPKPNMQVIVLALVAVITLFQSFQLLRINSKSTSVSPAVQTAPATTTSGSSSISTGSSAGGSNANVPQSMVGGC